MGLAMCYIANFKLGFHFRSSPDFKKKLRERRRLAAKRAAASRGPKLPDFSDQEAVQRFFLQEVISIQDRFAISIKVVFGREKNYIITRMFTKHSDVRLFIKVNLYHPSGATGRGAAGAGRRGERRGAPEPGGGGVRPAPLPPRRPPADTPAPDLPAPSPGEREDMHWKSVTQYRVTHLVGENLQLTWVLGVPSSCLGSK